MNDYRMYRNLVLLQRDPSEYLVHYGVSKADGAKRGSGRYPLGSGERPHQHDGEYQRTGSEARKATRQLNKLDREKADWTKRNRKSERKYEKLKSKGVSVDSKKFQKALRNKEFTEKNLNAAKAKQEAIVRDMTQKGYTINSKEVNRMAEKGKAFLSYYVAGLPGLLIYAHGSTVNGTKFKVRLSDADGAQAKNASRLDALDKKIAKEQRAEAGVDFETLDNNVKRARSKSSGSKETNKLYRDYTDAVNAYYANVADYKTVKAAADRFINESKGRSSSAAPSYEKATEEYNKAVKDYNRAENNYKQLMSDGNFTEKQRKSADDSMRRAEERARKQLANRAKALRNSGYTYAEIAKRLGTSTGSVSAIING